MTLAITQNVRNHLEQVFPPEEVAAAFDEKEFELIEVEKNGNN